MTKHPSLDDVAVFLRKHPDFRGISSRGLCVLVYREGTVSCPVTALTADERADIMTSKRRGRFTKEELADAAANGIVLPTKRKGEAEEPTL